jgi:hypothetical protein
MYYVENVSIKRKDIDGIELDLKYNNRQFNIIVERVSGASWNHSIRNTCGIKYGCITTLMINEIMPLSGSSNYHSSVCRCHYGWTHSHGHHWIVECEDSVTHIYDWVLKLFN